MQAIETKYLGPSNYRGSRIKAVCERGSLTVDYDDALDTEQAHIAAVKALCAKFVREDIKEYGPESARSSFWAKPFVTGGLKGRGYAHVFIAERNGQS